MQSAAAKAEPIIQTPFGPSTEQDVAARDRLKRINVLFGRADSAAHQVRDKLWNAKRINGYPAFGETARRDAQVRDLLTEAAEANLVLGSLIRELAALQAAANVPGA